MQESSSGGNRNSRNRQSRPRSGGGNRNNNRRSSGGSGSGESRRESSHGRGPASSRPPRGESRYSSRDKEPEIIRRSSAPKATGFQKFVKFITFGLVDLTRKKPTSRASRANDGKAPRPEKKDRRERREPLIVEPTTPRLYVGNLSYDATGDDLSALFGDYGTVVEAAIVTQPGSARSKGFAFVEMSSVEEAKAAATALNDKDFQGRQMLVTGAKSEGRNSEGERAPRAPRGERPPREGRSGEGRGRGERGRGGDRDLIEKPTRQVKPLEIEVVTSPSLNVAHLNAEASEIDVTDLFAGIGTIQHRADAGSPEGGLTKTLRVDLSDTTEAQKAVELLDGKFFMGHQIRVTGVKGEG